MKNKLIKILSLIFSLGMISSCNDTQTSVLFQTESIIAKIQVGMLRSEVELILISNKINFLHGEIQKKIFVIHRSNSGLIIIKDTKFIILFDDQDRVIGIEKEVIYTGP